MSAIIAVVVLFLLLFGFWWLYFIEYRSYRLDDTRQKLFEIRDRLHRQAAEGKISFDSRAYRVTRKMLNGSIRYVNRMSLINLIAVIVAATTEDVPAGRRRFRAEFDEALQSLDHGGRTLIRSTHIEMHVVLLRHVARNSIPLWILSLVANAVDAMWSHVPTRRILKNRAWDVIDEEVMSDDRRIAA